MESHESRTVIAGAGAQHISRGAGIFEIRFRGLVSEREMRVVAENAVRYGEECGVGAVRAVLVVDLSELVSFSPESRKVFGSIKPKDPSLTINADYFISGASIKNKAMFALVLTAARLLGDAHWDVSYTKTIEESWRLAEARRDEHVAAGRLRAVS
jgi:hypothetical protein